MIKANELRIGNCVLYERGMWEVEEMAATTVRLAHQEGNISVTDIDGIPLSPSILESCGFVKCKSPYRDRDAFVIGKDAGRIVWCDGELFKPIAEGENSFIRITTEVYPTCQYPAQYLHQLQNLIFSLRGTEIDIKNITG